MHRTLCLTIGLLALVARATAQPSFELLRLDPAHDDAYWYPAVKVTDANTLRCRWASYDQDSVGAYERHVDFGGGLIGDCDTLIIESFDSVTCVHRESKITSCPAARG